MKKVFGDILDLIAHPNTSDPEVIAAVGGFRRLLGGTLPSARFGAESRHDPLFDHLEKLYNENIESLQKANAEQQREIERLTAVIADCAAATSTPSPGKVRASESPKSKVGKSSKLYVEFNRITNHQLERMFTQSWPRIIAGTKRYGEWTKGNWQNKKNGANPFRRKEKIAVDADYQHWLQHGCLRPL